MSLRFSVFIATSVDGFIARLDHGLDWLPGMNSNEATTSEHESLSDEDHGFHEFMADIDALLMGSNTYKVLQGFEGDWPYGDAIAYVLSNSLKPDDIPARHQEVVKLIQGNPDQVQAILKQDGIQHVYVDGGQVIQDYLRAGLIERLIITRVPVLIGEGIALFGALPTDIRLKLEKSQSFSTGLVQNTYIVQR